MEVYINYISCYLPEKKLSNSDIELLHPEWSIEKISSKTGIFSRSISGDDEFSSDLAIKACNDLFSNYAGIRKNEIEYLIVCTQTPDYLLPSTSCLVQDKLGLNQSIGAVDVNQGCSGFVYSLGLAKGLIASGQVSNVLLVTVDTYTKLINPLDKSNKTLFGDAACATLISNANVGLSAKIEQFVYGTNGSGCESLIVKNGGVRNRKILAEDVIENENFVRNDNDLFMDGRAVFEFTINVVPSLVKDVLSKNNLTIEKIDKFVFHQANKFMLDKIRIKAGIPADKFIFNSEYCGNTVSSTIPNSLKILNDSKAFQSGEIVMICGFGVGLSYGGAIIKIE
ncbi:3-oxoacyl-ACP synthase III family protein [Flavobacterium plurextorum]|uniref:3-oxoacyl-ACP synthase III family protein n=1 Tax=Flavobacterium plurextorum TaxID=1114867 RepID=UPI00375779B8